MRIHAALDSLIELEWRVARLYTRFYGRFSELPAVAGIWWEMALDEHEHVGVLTMVKELADPWARVVDIRHRLRLFQATIAACERAAAGEVTLSHALGMAVRLERSELDRLGRETVRAIGGDLPPIPPSAFAPHEAHLERLMRTVRKFGGEEVVRSAWDLTPEGRVRSHPSPMRPASARAGRTDSVARGGKTKARGRMGSG
jgi:hypothetical protein